MASLASTDWFGSYRASLRADRTHWTAVWLYGSLCAIGALSPVAGAVLLTFFAFCASLRVLLRNGWLLALMAGAAAASTFFPPLGVLLALVAIYFLLRRIAFIFENIRVIGLGLLVYGVAVGAMLGADEAARAALEWTAVPALQDETVRHVLAGLGAGALTSALMHDVLVTTYKRGYTTAKALEIMSMIPLLLLSLLLPLLKLHFSVEVPAGPGFHGLDGLHHGSPDLHGYGAVGEAVPEAMAAGQAAGLGRFVHGPLAAEPSMGFHAAPHGALHAVDGHLGAPEPLAPHFAGAAAAHPLPGFPPPLHAPEPQFHPAAPMHVGPAVPSAVEPFHPLPVATAPHPFVPASAPFVAPSQNFVQMMTADGPVVVHHFGLDTSFQHVGAGAPPPIHLHHPIAGSDTLSQGHVVHAHIDHGPGGDVLHDGMSSFGGMRITAGPDGFHHLVGPQGLDLVRGHVVNGQWQITDMRPGMHPTYLPQSGSLSFSEVLIGLRIV